MSQADQLREMVATMLMLPESEVGSETPLAALDNSLGGARLKLGVKRLGLSLPNGSRPATFGELQAILSGKEASFNGHAAAAGKQVTASVDPGGLQIGLDAQDIRALPAADDYWEHEFYTGVFAPPEIAYAVRQSDPRIHFAGFWCAKEALRKCDSLFAGVELASIMVLHDPDGKPYLSRQTPSVAARLPHVLSLSHTGDIAMAVVIRLSLPLEQPPHSEQIAPAPPPRGSLLALAAVFALLAGALYLLVRYFYK